MAPTGPADGFHRLFAHRLLAENEAVSSMLAKLDQEVDYIDALVHRGTQRDAVLFSVGATNPRPGPPRKAEDKRQAIATLIRDMPPGCSATEHSCLTKPREEQCWNARADREIARECVVSHTTVADERQKFMEKLRLAKWPVYDPDIHPPEDRAADDDGCQQHLGRNTETPKIDPPEVGQYPQRRGGGHAGRLSGGPGRLRPDGPAGAGSTPRPSGRSTSP